MTQAKVTECFFCLKQCKCFKCSKEEFVVVASTNVMQGEEKQRGLADFENEPVPEGGLFRGKNLGAMPDYLKRIYQYKKIIYTKHQVSAPVRTNPVNSEQNKDKGSREPIKTEKKKMEEPLLEEPAELSVVQ